MDDLMGLYDNILVSVDPEETGRNANVLVVGSPFSGKTKTHTESRMAHTNDSSLVVALSKREVRELYRNEFEKRRGYRTEVIDFSDPSGSTIGYDFMKSCKNAEDVRFYAQSIIKCLHGDKHPDDLYWEEQYESLAIAFMHLEIENAQEDEREPSFINVIDMINALSIGCGENDLIGTNFDDTFELIGHHNPKSKALYYWKAFSQLPSKTAGCVKSELQGVINKVFSENVIEVMRKEKQIDFPDLGSTKTVLFVITSPVDEGAQAYVNVMYADMIKTLFDHSEKIGHSLDVPVQIICDDFACTGKIEGFDKYISVFRAAGISVSILLQSESQLRNMYGDNAATTIINNCDTYLYFGGMDVETCNKVAIRANKPVDQIISMPLEHIWVFRRGCKPVYGLRFQIMNDTAYQRVVRHYRNDLLKDYRH